MGNGARVVLVAVLAALSTATSAAAETPVARLLGTVPPQIKATCTQVDPSPKRLGGIAELRCRARDGIRVSYVLYPTQRAMSTAYLRSRKALGIANDQGRGCRKQTSEGSFGVGKTSVGRYLCVARTASMQWYDKRVLVGARATARAGGLANLRELYDWWACCAGPVTP